MYIYITFIDTSSVKFYITYINTFSADFRKTASFYFYNSPPSTFKLLPTPMGYILQPK